MRLDRSRYTPGISFLVSRFLSRHSRFGPVARATLVGLALSVLLVAQAGAVGRASGTAAKSQDTAESAGESLPPLAQAAISAAIGHDQPAYHATSSPSGARMRNEGNNFSVEFSDTGLDLKQVAHRFGMRLRESGRGQVLHEVAAATPSASANRVEYRRGDLVEWYANGPLGLEQGFTLARASGLASEGPITLGFALSGSLTGTVDPDARGVTLRKGDNAVLRYAGLAAVDARGADLPAWLELAGDRLLLRVDDTGARYPVTIDPVLHSTRLTSNRSLCTIGGICDYGSAGDRFGASVAVSSDGNTVAVAAPYATGSNVGSGAVYVFRKPGFGGWSGCIVIGCLDYTAKLTSAPGLIQAGFGAAVAMSGDASTIAVLGDTLGNPDSAAGLIFVYQRPSSCWTSTGIAAAILSLTTVTETPCGFSGNTTDCNTDFTSSIDVSGDGSAIVLGYSGALVAGRSRGAAYVYVRAATGWVSSYQPVKLTRAGGALRDLLGQAVSISADGSTIAVAAPQANGSLGAVDVFLKGGNGWTNQTQSAELTYTPGNGLLFLGNSVDVDANGTVVVAGGNGRALIFPQPSTELCTRQGCFEIPIWLNRYESAVLTGSNNSPIAWPRISEDSTRVVAAGFESPGMLYAFLMPPSGWVSANQNARFAAASGAPGDLLGYSTIVGAPAFGMSGNGSVLVAGAPGTTVGTQANQGAAHLFLPEPGVAAALAAGVTVLSAVGSRRRVSRR